MQCELVRLSGPDEDYEYIEIECACTWEYADTGDRLTVINTWMRHVLEKANAENLP